MVYNYVLLEMHPEIACPAEVLGPETLGIEVTIPKLACGCGLGNVDPQHGPQGSLAQAAIEACWAWPVPACRSSLVTLRADLDALGGMALLTLRAEGYPLHTALRQRIRAVAREDRFERGAWRGRRGLAATAAKIARSMNSGCGVPAVHALAWDPSVPLVGRVGMIKEWLVDGIVPTTYRDRAREYAKSLLRELRRGQIAVSTTADGRIAVVESEMAGALRFGYCRAPVVVALNPRFQPENGAPQRKITIAQYTRGHADLRAVAADLGRCEPGWGGSPNIIGSPQGIASSLDLNEVIAVVSRRLSPQSPLSRSKRRTVVNRRAA